MTPSLIAGLPGSALAGNAEVAHFALDNGLEVVVIPDRRAPVVTHMVWYRNGSADDPLGQSGIAHFLEHLMFKGTERHPAGEFSQVVSALGGQENAFTSFDYTAYFQRVAKEHLGTMMEFEADRMIGLVLDDAVVAPERDVVLEERRMRVETDPAAQLSEAMAAALFVHHPYGIPIIGWSHEIAALDREDALGFYKRFYAPNNALLVIAGDVGPDEVRKLAEETFGKLPPHRSLNDRSRPQEPEHYAPVKVELEDARAGRMTVQRYYLTPSYATAAPGEAEALDLLMRIAAAGSVSKLYKRLVIEQKKAASAGGWYSDSGLDDGRVAFYAIGSEKVTPDELEKAIDRVDSTRATAEAALAPKKDEDDSAGDGAPPGKGSP